MKHLWITLAAACLLTGCAAEADAPQPTGQPAEANAPALELTGRVVDAADVLSPEAEKQLTAMLGAIETDTLAQVVVATTPSLDGQVIDAYSLDLARSWSIGDATRNDGLLVLVAPNERVTRIEVGLGLEETVTNAEAQVIIEDAMLPHFSKGDYATGLIDAVDALAAELSDGQDLKEAA